MNQPAEATPSDPMQAHAVQRSELPLSCPQPSMVLWNAHPRVYLPIEAEGGRSECPYCGARYVLVD